MPGDARLAVITVRVRRSTERNVTAPRTLYPVDDATEEVGMGRIGGSAAARLAGFGAASVLVFTAAWTAGGAVSSTAGGVPETPTAGAPGDADPGDVRGDGGVLAAGLATGDATTGAGGVLTTAAGYTLTPVGIVYPWREPTEVAFTVTGSDDAPVTRFDTPSDGSGVMDVAVLRRDVAGYQRLRATQGPDGVWRAPVRFPGQGVWRLYAGFTPTGGPHLDLGADLHVPGTYGAFTFPAENRAGLCGGSDQQVRLDGALVPGGESRLFATVGRDGTPVTDLEPVDGGAFGRMTAVRQGDLARFPVRPEITGAAATDRSGPGVAFAVSVPAPGSYQLFLDYRSGGVLRSCEFTLPTAPGS
ncbi:putative secreted protein [Pseudonocardia sp. Ae717_Ps2]|nr:putative secreted protein [Pseudonocardia sp. Ae717_Ps2]